MVKLRLSTRNLAARRRTCGICAEEKPGDEFQPASETCQHETTTCVDCLERWIWTCILTNYRPGSGAIKCPDCDEEIHAKDLPALAHKHYFSIYRRINNNQNPAWRWCLDVDCELGRPHFPSANQSLTAPDICKCRGKEKDEIDDEDDEDDKDPNKCHAKACVLCDRPWDSQHDCQQYAEDHFERQVEDSLSRKVIEAEQQSGKIRRCPQCLCPAVNDGPLKMLKDIVCQRCRMKFDWDSGALRYSQKEEEKSG